MSRASLVAKPTGYPVKDKKQVAMSTKAATILEAAAAKLGGCTEVGKATDLPPQITSFFGSSPFLDFFVLQSTLSICRSHDFTTFLLSTIVLPDYPHVGVYSQLK